MACRSWVDAAGLIPVQSGKAERNILSTFLNFFFCALNSTQLSPKWNWTRRSFSAAGRCWASRTSGARGSRRRWTCCRSAAPLGSPSKAQTRRASSEPDPSTIGRLIVVVCVCVWARHMIFLNVSPLSNSSYISTGRGKRSRPVIRLRYGSERLALLPGLPAHPLLSHPSPPCPPLRTCRLMLMT